MQQLNGTWSTPAFPATVLCTSPLANSIALHLIAAGAMPQMARCHMDSPNEVAQAVLPTQQHTCPACKEHASLPTVTYCQQHVARPLHSPTAAIRNSPSPTNTVPKHAGPSRLAAGASKNLHFCKEPCITECGGHQVAAVFTKADDPRRDRSRDLRQAGSQGTGHGGRC